MYQPTDTPRSGLGEEDPSVTILRRYLRIRTVHPNPDYAGAVDFLQTVANDYGFETRVIELVPGKPILMITWPGSNPSLKSVLFNSHMDVVPVEEDKWIHPPFDAYKDEEGNIYARGVQDMKYAGIQQLEAIHRLRESGFVPLRTIIVTYVPDEEIGGYDGMFALVQSEIFDTLNIGFSIDEGSPFVGNQCPIFYGERKLSAYKIVSRGEEGHSSLLYENTAVQKLMHFLDYFVRFRDSELRRMVDNNLDLGEVTTLNINMIKSGVFGSDYQTWQNNVIPSTAEAAMDIRMTMSVNPAEFHENIVRLAAEAGVEVTSLDPQTSKLMVPTLVTPLDVDGGIWFDAIRSALNKHDLIADPKILVATTDGRHTRDRGIPTFGFSPGVNTSPMAHCHNEVMNERNFLIGINVFASVISALSSVN